LKDACQDIGRGLAANNSNHDKRQSTQVGVSETSIKSENRCFDEAQTGIVKDGGYPNDLSIFDEILLSSVQNYLNVTSEATLHGHDCDDNKCPGENGSKNHQI